MASRLADLVKMLPLSVVLPVKRQSVLSSPIKERNVYSKLGKMNDWGDAGRAVNLDLRFSNINSSSLNLREANDRQTGSRTTRLVRKFPQIMHGGV
jgi:hypothetical protein